MTGTSWRPAVAAAACGAVLALAGDPAWAEGEALTFGVEGEPSSIDPHFQRLLVNDAFASHIFEPLVKKTSEVGYAPALADSWRAVDPMTWEFTLRKGVKFHDGTDFDAADVLYTIGRIPNVKGSPSLRTLNVAPIKETQVLDPHTIRIVTNRPTPILPKMLAEVYVVSDSVKTDDPNDFNQGKAAFGTGPYKFVERVAGDRIVLERNDAYWGAKPDYAKVTFRPIGAAAARAAALLSGGVDVIDNPSSNDIPRLKADPNIRTHTVETCRVIYLTMDQAREPSPFVEGTDGKNPFKDRRVRQAVSHAIDRDAIVERVMGGRATPAGLMTSKTVFGHNPDLKPDAYDPEAAKRLLAEAGYPNGFKLVLHGPNDRYINDERVLQAVAQQLARVGIQASVEALPRAVYFPDLGKHSLSLWGQGCGGGEAHHGLTTMIYTPGKISGFGGSNAGKYSNPEIDALIDTIMSTGDEAERARLQRLAEAKVKEDVAIVPLYWEHNTWATRKGVRFEGGVEQWNVATAAFVER